MKKTIKIFSIILMVSIFVLFLANTVLALDAGGILQNLEGKTNNTKVNSDSLLAVGGNIINIITTVAIVISVIVLLIIGIKYMMGSASEKAEYKKTMIPYLVGAVIIFGASAIAKAVVLLAGGITGNATN